MLEYISVFKGLGPQLGLSALNLVLITFSVWLSWKTNKFQRRTAVRESIEQLDNYMLNNRNILMTSLKDFSYGLRSQKTIIALQIGNIHHSISGNFQTPDKKMINLCEENYEKIPCLEKVKYDVDLQEIEATLSTTDSVECIEAIKIIRELVKEDFLHKNMEESGKEYERDTSGLFYRSVEGSL